MKKSNLASSNLESSTSLSADHPGLDKVQLRLLRSLQQLLPHLMTTEDENEFFESGRELLKLFALSLNQSNFEKKASRNKKFSYATQALEFALDHLEEDLKNSQTLILDN